MSEYTREEQERLERERLNREGHTTADGQHVNPDGRTDAEKASTMGGVAGTITGAVAGSAAGPLGTVAGAAIGGVVGAAGSKAAVGQVDKHDDDSKPINDKIKAEGIQTGGHAVDGTPDTRGILEKVADAITGDNIDDKTGKVVENKIGRNNLKHETDQAVVTDRSMGNDVPGIQTGGHAVDGTPDTRGIMEKTADALTGDKIDDKTGKPVR